VIGKTFGRLKVISENPVRSPSRERRYDCLCSCGKTITRRGGVLRSGVQSCGCLRIELFVKRNTTHALCGHELHYKWNSMLERCRNKNITRAHRYIERGISMCEEWKNDFLVFYTWSINNGWEPGLMIDRINNNGDYSPDNCRFVTAEQSNRNLSFSKRWVINDIVYEILSHASKGNSVCEATIKRWCDGYITMCGNYSPPKEHCYSYNLYGSGQ
jgi:hypothetical protein